MTYADDLDRQARDLRDQWDREEYAGRAIAKAEAREEEKR